MNKLFLIVNEDVFFLSHRKNIAIQAQKQGFNVTIVAKDTGKRFEILSLGLNFIDLPINPTGENIYQELKTLKFLFQLYRKGKPDIVHHVGLKNILWGSLAAKLSGVKNVVNAVSGLGVLFSSDYLSFKSKIILNLLRYSFINEKTITIFQNNEDKKLFFDYKIASSENSVFIKGSGVDLNDYDNITEPESEKINVIFTARMVKEKGVLILAEAAELLRNEYENKVVFLLCGGLSKNPNALTEEELHKVCDEKYIKWLGYRSDIKDLIKQSHIVAFPSYYREGVPKSLIEATAIGRPIITTNSIGCKDTVEEGYNGYLVPIKDSKAVAEKLKILIDNKELRVKMGKNSRLIAERDFSIDNVVNSHLDIYNRFKS